MATAWTNPVRGFAKRLLRAFLLLWEYQPTVAQERARLRRQLVFLALCSPGAAIVRDRKGWGGPTEGLANAVRIHAAPSARYGYAGLLTHSTTGTITWSSILAREHAAFYVTLPRGRGRGVYR